VVFTKRVTSPRQWKPLTSTEWAFLRSIVLKRSPGLITLADASAEPRVLTQPERESLRETVARELMEFGYLGTASSDKYGATLDGLIEALGLASEWPD
jgi:hypothetical protein